MEKGLIHNLFRILHGVGVKRLTVQKAHSGGNVPPDAIHVGRQTPAPRGPKTGIKT